MKLGNVIAFITKWTGIAWVTKRLFPNCGCERRQIKLNNLFTKKKSFPVDPTDIIFD